MSSARWNRFVKGWRNLKQTSRLCVACNSFTQVNRFNNKWRSWWRGTTVSNGSGCRLLLFLMSMLETSAWIWNSCRSSVCSCGCQSCLPVIGHQHRHGGLHNWASHNGSCHVDYAGGPRLSGDSVQHWYRWVWAWLETCEVRSPRAVILSPNSLNTAPPVQSQCLVRTWVFAYLLNEVQW